MKALFLTLALLLSLPTWGAAVGTHGMVLLQTQQGLVASHMPLHGSMHAHQVVLSLSVAAEQQQQLTTILAQYPLVTIQPERFDLHHLMHGALNQFKAKVVAGHFERGGETAIETIDFSVDAVLLNQPLSEQENGHFFPIVLGEQTLLVHRIGPLPSYDQILLTDSVITSDTALKLSAQTPLVSTSSNNVTTPLHSVYLETIDFQARD